MLTIYMLGFSEQTFNAKLLHIESRNGRSSKNGTTDLEFFMKCEVPASDVDVFTDSLKRVMEDVRSVPEEKGQRCGGGREGGGAPPSGTLTGFHGETLLSSTSQFPGFHDNWKTWTDAKCWSPNLIRTWTRNMQWVRNRVKKESSDQRSNSNTCLSFFFLKGYRDPEYRKRRAFIAEQAFRYKEWVRNRPFNLKEMCLFMTRLLCLDRGDPLPTLEYTAEELATWWAKKREKRFRLLKAWRRPLWPDVVLEGGRCTGSCAASTPAWPAGSSWTACSSWSRSVATGRIASLSSETFPPSWKVRLTGLVWHPPPSTHTH